MGSRTRFMIPVGKCMYGIGEYFSLFNKLSPFCLSCYLQLCRDSKLLVYQKSPVVGELRKTSSFSPDRRVLSGSRRWFPFYQPGVKQLACYSVIVLE